MNKPAAKVREIVEWVIILGVVSAAFFIFITHGGFVGHSDIQSYPY